MRSLASELKKIPNPVDLIGFSFEIETYEKFYHGHIYNRPRQLTLKSCVFRTMRRLSPWSPPPEGSRDRLSADDRRLLHLTRLSRAGARFYRNFACG